MTHILIVCTHQTIAATIGRLIDKIEGWKASVALSVNDALTNCNAQTFEAILIGSGVSQSEENTICAHLAAQNAKTPVIKHYGGGSGLLYAEIYQALKA